MPTFDQAPGALDVRAKAGDEFAMSPDFNVDLTGYSLAGGVKPASGGAETAFVIAVDNAALGQITLRLTEAETAALGAGSHRWYLAWTAPGSVKRTVLAGQFLLIP